MWKSRQTGLSLGPRNAFLHKIPMLVTLSNGYLLNYIADCLLIKQNRKHFGGKNQPEVECYFRNLFHVKTTYLKVNSTSFSKFTKIFYNFILQSEDNRDESGVAILVLLSFIKGNYNES